MMDGESFLKTDVDGFLELVRMNKKLSVQDAAHQMKVSQKTIQAWVDFLVEENILGIEYKFTMPYVYLIQGSAERLEMPTLGFETKEEFYRKGRTRGLSDNQIKFLWLKYVNANKGTMQKVFFEKAKDKGLDQIKAEELWQKYLSHLEAEI
jgi:hypothetical protein